jgi:phosphatidylglycerol lysyltransferase
VILILCVVALANFEPRLRWLDSNSFWEVILSPDVPNALRASIALIIALGGFALWRLLRPARTEYGPWDNSARSLYAALGTPAPLHADGIVWGEAGRAAIVFRRTGRILLALGDPAGDPEDHVSAIWRLRDLARQESRDPAAWRVGPALLDVYGDIGLAGLPLGPDGLPIADAEDAPGPHATHYLACVAERDLPALLPILPALARG